MSMSYIDNPRYQEEACKHLICSIILVALSDLYKKKSSIERKTAIQFFEDSNNLLDYYCDFLDEETGNAKWWRRKARDIIKNPRENVISPQMASYDRKEYKSLKIVRHNSHNKRNAQGILKI